MSGVSVRLSTARRIITNSRTFILQHPYIPRPMERQLLGVGEEVKQ